MNSIIKTAILTATVSVFVSMSNAQTSIYYSVDIGSDLEFSDPFQDGDEVLDPGDIYGVKIGLPQSRQLIKNDSIIFNGDPPPSSTVNKVPVQDYGYFDSEWPYMYFDMDGEDQLTNKFVNLEEMMPMIKVGGGLILNPDILLFSYEDDNAPGWWRNDVPVTTPPDHGVATNELLTSKTWASWTIDKAYATEFQIGLSTNPILTVYDDDVDALDTQTNRYWYWTSDHEAHYGTDPGDIYVTDRNSTGYLLAIDNLVLGVANGTDVDAFEFCITDDSAILTQFGLSASGAPYLAVIFSVDQDDPDTSVDESGGLNPKIIYISLLTGLNPGPYELVEKQEDVDAIALEESPKDWGDAPMPYPTLAANSGANHTISNRYYLGSLIDKEADGQPTLMADGDDNTNLSDEDGITFTSLMYEGQLASIVVMASGDGLLSGWIDFNLNGNWNDPGDILFTDLPMGDGVNNITITIPDNSSMTPFNTFARFRFSSQSMLTPTGAAVDGEVEDYRIAVYPNPDEGFEGSIDFGDADIIYPVLLANNGARHVMIGNFLGAIIDAEPDGQPSPDAFGDDITNGDEDGVSLLSHVIRGSNAVIRVFVNGSGFLTAWIDFNQDLDWSDLGEHIIDTYILSGFTNLSINVPSSAKLGDTFARFRFSSISGLSYDGFAANGEVEDYRFQIMQVASTNLVVTNIVTMTNSNVEVKWNNEPNVQYQLQITTNLTTNTTWTTIKTVTGGMSVDSNATDDIKFYRIVAPFTP